MVTYEMVKNDPAVKVYIQKAGDALKAIGFSEHSFAHVMHVAETAGFALRCVANAVYTATRQALDVYPGLEVVFSGGVASNSALRAGMEAACKKAGKTLFFPSPVYCTDNAAMIGAAAYYEYKKGVRHGLDLNAVPNLKIGQR